MAQLRHFYKLVENATDFLYFSNLPYQTMTNCKGESQLTILLCFYRLLNRYFTETFSRYCLEHLPLVCRNSL